MNQKTTIVIDGKADSAILKTILKDKISPEKYSIYSSSGHSDALSAAHTLLSVSDKKVLLLLDTHTVNEGEMDEKKQFVKEYVPVLPGKKLKTIWMEPEIEILFLNNPKFLLALTDKPVSKELIEVGQAAPKRALEIISGKKSDGYLDLLDKEEIRNEFFKEGPVKEIYDFIENA